MLQKKEKTKRVVKKKKKKKGPNTYNIQIGISLLCLRFIFNSNMSSVSLDSDDRYRFDFDISPTRSNSISRLSELPIATPNKSQEYNTAMMKAYSPVITVSPSSESSQNMNISKNRFRLNGDYSSQAKLSKNSLQDNSKSSNTSNSFSSLLPPISIGNIYQKSPFDELGYLYFEKFSQKDTGCESPHFPSVEASRHGNQIRSSPVCTQDIPIDKDLFTSEGAPFPNVAYPWIVKQESDICNAGNAFQYPSDIDENIPPSMDIPHLFDPKLENKKEIYQMLDVEEPPNPEEVILEKKYSESVSVTGNSSAMIVRLRLPIEKFEKYSEEERKLKDFSSKRLSNNHEDTESNSKRDSRSSLGESISGFPDNIISGNQKMTRSRLKKSNQDNNYSEKLEKKRKLGPRSKSGCWTCRVRHKSCPEERPRCSLCVRLSLKCDYSSIRPKYMTDPVQQENRLKEIRSITYRQKKNKSLMRKHNKRS